MRIQVFTPLTVIPAKPRPSQISDYSSFSRGEKGENDMRICKCNCSAFAGMTEILLFVMGSK